MREGSKVRIIKGGQGGGSEGRMKDNTRRLFEDVLRVEGGREWVRQTAPQQTGRSDYEC